MQTNKTRDVYTMVTNQIITQLEQGVIPWRKPWQGAGIPQNVVSKRPYRGINIWLLASLGYERNHFLTYKQLQDIGGKVKQGEKGHLVVFWKIVDAPKEDAATASMEVKKKTLLRYFWVFNVSQCENIPLKYQPEMEERNSPLLSCENMVDGMPNAPAIVHKEPDAYYHPGKDYVNMPKLKTFESSEAYYSVLFHELVHSTGHKRRLNRMGVQEMTPFGSDIYSTEEIIAELGTCYLTASAGIAPVVFENNVAYLQGWIDRLREDSRIIIYASTQAQKATDYILGVKPEETDVEPVAEEETAETVLG